MNKIGKTSLCRRTADILRSNDGTSIVLVTIIAIIIIASVIILRITTSSLWASAGRQYNQDQAYEMANSMGASIDYLISDGTISLRDYTAETTVIDSKPTYISNARVVVKIMPSGDGFVVEVTATVADASYVYSAFYSKSGSSSYERQML